MQRGLILAYLAEYARAAELLADGIGALPESIRGSEWVAWYRVQEASARAAAGDVDEAVAGLLAALRVLVSAGGAKTHGEIAAIQRLLAVRWPGHPAVDELRDALR